MADPRVRGTRTCLKITLDVSQVEADCPAYSGDAAILAWAQAFVATLGQGRVTHAVVAPHGWDEGRVVIEEVTASYEDVAKLCEPDDSVTAYKFV